MKTWFALLLFVALAQSPAADPLATLAELRTALREELKSALDKGNVENNQRIFQLESLLVENLPDKELPDERMAQTIQALLQVRAISRDKKVSELSERLVDELRTQARAAAKRLQENFNTTLARCLRDGFKATKPRELDAPLKEIAGLKRQLAMVQNRNSDVQTAFNSQGLQTIEGLLNTYQDLLFAAEKGIAATNTAQRLTGDYSYREMNDIIPRSEFLELVNAAMNRIPKKGEKPGALSPEEFNTKLQETIDGVNNMDDLGGALETILEFIQIQEKAIGNTYNGGVTGPIKKINKIHEDIQAGLGSTVDVSLLLQREEGDRTGKIKNMLLRFLMPRILGIDEGSGIRENETLALFLARTTAKAIEKRDWSQLAKVLDFCQRLPANQSPLGTTDSSAFKQFLAGQNLERAHQYAAAVASYHSALKTGSQMIPVEFIGERLTAIEKEHAKDYQAGIELANTPVIERYFPGSRPGMYPPVSSSLRLETPQPIQLLPAAKSAKTPVPDGEPQKAEPKPPTAKPTEPQPSEKKRDPDKQ